MTIRNVRVKDTRVAYAEVSGMPTNRTGARSNPINPIAIVVEYDGGHGAPVSVMITGESLDRSGRVRGTRPVRRTLPLSTLDEQDEWIRDFVAEHAPDVPPHVHGIRCGHRIPYPGPAECQYCTPRQLAGQRQPR